MDLLDSSTAKSTLVGFCADFCTACRQIQAFTVNRQSKVSSFFFITTESSARYELTCHGCKAVSYLPRDQEPATIMDSADVDAMKALHPASTIALWEKQMAAEGTQIDPLVGAPAVVDEAAERLRRITSIITGSESIVAPALTASPRFGKAGLTCFAICEASFIGFVVVGQIIVGGEIEGAVIGTLFCVSFMPSLLVSAVYVAATNSGRVMAEQFYPLMAIKLAELNPTESELTVVKSQLTRAHRIRIFRVPLLLAAIAARRQRVRTT